MKTLFFTLVFSVLLMSCGSSGSSDSTKSTTTSTLDDKYECDDLTNFNAGLSEGRNNKGNPYFTCDYYWDLDKNLESQGKKIGDGSKACFCKGYNVGQNEQ